MSNFRDSPTERLWLGIIVPTLLVALALFNLFTGRVYWLAGRSGVPEEKRLFIFQVLTGGWHIGGTVLLKLGVAAGLIAWFLLPEYKRAERLVRPFLVGAVVLAVSGIALHVLGFFR